MAITIKARTGSTTIWYRDGEEVARAQLGHLDQNIINCTVTIFSCSDPTIRDEEVEEYQSMGEAKERFDGIAGDLAKRYLPDTAVELAVNGRTTELAATHTDPRGNLWTIHSDGSIYWADDFAYYERSLRGIFNCIDFWACQWAATDRN